jgi:hypothetical protein
LIRERKHVVDIIDRGGLTYIYALQIHMSRLIDSVFAQLTNRASGQRKVESRPSLCSSGDGLFARTVVKQGEMVFEEFPIGGTAIAYFDFQHTYCSNCIRLLEADTVISCDTCQSKYCSMGCKQRADGFYHVALCGSSAFREYTRFATETSNEYYIVAARLLAMFPHAPWMFHYHCPEWVPEDPNELDRMHDLLHASLKESVVVPMQDVEAVSTDKLARTIGMFRVNSLGLRYDDTAIGLAVYPTQSIMNHSSDPNCRCVTFCSTEFPDTPCLCGIEALRPIARGEELTIDYVGKTGRSADERTEILASQYGIHDINSDSDHS